VLHKADAGIQHLAWKNERFKYTSHTNLKYVLHYIL